MADKSVQATEVKAPVLANPAAVGLAGFGATTLLLQFANLGLISTGPVMWLALFFGGLAQLIAGFQEFKTGNSFGFAAFVTYGAFWMAKAGMYLNNVLAKNTTSGFVAITGVETGWFYVVFTILTAIYFIGAMKQSGALSFVFLTLLLGFIGLDIGHLAEIKAIDTLAAWILIVCGGSALYLMAHVALTPLKINVPIGKGWTK
jgi:uncharacterized protein